MANQMEERITDGMLFCIEIKLTSPQCKRNYTMKSKIDHKIFILLINSVGGKFFILKLVTHVNCFTSNCFLWLSSHSFP